MIYFKSQILAFLMLFIAASCTSQDFIFKWNLDGYYHSYYEVSIASNTNKRLIKLKSKVRNDSITEKISQKDCNTLYEFCANKFNYRNSGYSNKMTSYYKLCDTSMNKDNTRILVEGKSILPAQMTSYGYFLDSSTSIYYRIDQNRSDDFIDKYIFSGSFTYHDQSSYYRIHSDFLTETDLELNLLVYNLIMKYNSRVNLEDLEYIMLHYKPKKDYK